MAQRLSESSKLSLTVQTGTSESGKAVTATRSVNNVNPDLIDDDAYSVAVKLGALQKYAVTKITRTDSAVLGADD